MKYIKLYELYVTKQGTRLLNPKDELLHASMEGDLEHVKKMIRKEKVKPTYRKNATIYYAVENNHPEVVKFLLRYKNIEKNRENQLIPIAAKEGYLEIIKLLLKDGRFNASGYLNSNDPIRNAYNNGYDDIVYLLLNQPEVYNHLSKEAIKRYAKGKPLVIDMIKKLNEDTFDKEERFLIACTTGDIKTIQALINEIDPSTLDNSAIQHATYNGHSEIVKLLLKDDRVDPSVDDNWAIRAAAFRGHNDIVYLLLNHPKVYNSLSKQEIKKFAKGRPLVIDMIKKLNEDTFIDDLKHEMALMIEIEKPEVDMNYINQIIEAGNLPTEKDLITAAAWGHVDLVKLFIEKYNLDPTAFNNQAVRRAVNNDHTEVVEYLLTFKEVDTNTKDGAAIKYAAENGYTKVVKILLNDDRVDPSVDNNYAIRWAAYRGHSSIVNMLLKEPRVDPSAGYNYAIRAAAENGKTSTVALLMKDDRVDPSDVDNQAIKAAAEKNHFDIVELLLKDDRVDPSVNKGFVVKEAISAGNIDLVKKLLKDDRVDPSARYNYVLRKALNYFKDEKELILQLLKDKRVRSYLSEEELLNITKSYVGNMLKKLNQ